MPHGYVHMYFLLAGLLAGLSLLPKQNWIGVAAAVALASFLSELFTLFNSEYDGDLYTYLIVGLGFIQAAIAVAAVLFETGLLAPPTPKPAAPSGSSGYSQPGYGQGGYGQSGYQQAGYHPGGYPQQAPAQQPYGGQPQQQYYGQTEAISRPGQYPSGYPQQPQPPANDFPTQQYVQQPEAAAAQQPNDSQPTYHYPPQSTESQSAQWPPQQPSNEN
jgi:hypothetical protein